METFQISGRVINPATKQGIINLKVELLVKNNSTGEVIPIRDPDPENHNESSIYNEDGSFILTWERNPIELSGVDIDIFFKVLMGGILLTETEYSIINNHIPETASIHLTGLPDTTYVNQTQRRIHGKVLTNTGEPIHGFIVRAYYKTFGNEQLINKGQQPAITDAAGHYFINYIPEKTEERVNIIIKAFKEEQDPDPQVTSPLILNAKDDEEINLVVGNDEYIGKSSYTKVSENLSGIVGIEPMEYSEIELLANEKKYNSTDISYFLTAQYLFEKYVLDKEIIYGLLKKGISSSLNSLLLQPKVELKNALKAAVDENIISEIDENVIDTAVTNLKTKVATIALSDSNSQINKFFDLTKSGEEGAGGPLSESRRTDFITAFVNHEGSEDEFWSLLINPPGEPPEFIAFEQNEVDYIKTIFKLSHLSDGIVEVIGLTWGDPGVEKSLIEEFKSDVYLVAEKTFDFWNQDGLIDDETIPVSYADEDGQNKKQNYINKLLERIELEYPTPVLLERIKSSNVFDGYDPKHNLEIFLDIPINKTNFKFGEKAIDEYLVADTTTPIDLTGIQGNEVDFVNQLKTLQRLYKVVPSINKENSVIELWTKNYHSPFDIVRNGKHRFIEDITLSAAMPIENAELIYQKSAETVFQAMATFTKYSEDINSIGTQVFESKAYADGSTKAGDNYSLPTMSDLFGSLDYCGCKHCNSVYSPAAYLTDILNFLKNTEITDTDPDTNYNTLLEKLLHRRPDLEYILLNCKNAETPMPHIDLINEVLANAVEPLPPLPPDNDPGYINWQTEVDASILKAYPEHLNEGAYGKLLSNVFPWNSTFHLWNKEARTYLSHLKFSRYKMMKEFPYYDEIDSVYKNHEDIHIASESLGISEDELDFITLPLGAQADLLPFYDFIGTPPQFLMEMTYITNLIQKTGLEYPEILEVFESIYINPYLDPHNQENRQYHILPIDGGDPCKLEDLRIYNWDGNPDTPAVTFGLLDNLHRFVRLKRKLEWSVAELDIAILALSPDIIDGGFIESLSIVNEIKKSTKLNVEKIVTFWSDIDTNTYNSKVSFYDSIFKNKAINNPEVEYFNLDSTETHYINDDSIPFIAAILNISNEEFEFIHNNLIEGTGNDPVEIKIETLSYLYRVTLFCKTYDIDIKSYYDLASLKGIQEITYFNGNGYTPEVKNPQETLNFINELRDLQKAPFSISEINYLLSNTKNPSKDNAPEAENIQSFLDELRTNLKKINDEGLGLLESYETNFTSQFSKTDTSGTPVILEKTAITNCNSFVSDPDNFEPDPDDYSGLDEDILHDYIKKNKIFFPDSDSAINNLTPNGTNFLSTENERRKYVSGMLGEILTNDSPDVSEEQFDKILTKTQVKGIIQIIDDTSLADIVEKERIIDEQPNIFADTEEPKTKLVYDPQAGLDKKFIISKTKRIEFIANSLDSEITVTDRTALQNRLQLFMDEKDVRMALEIIDDFDTANLKYDNEVKNRFIEDHFASFADVSSIKEKLVGNSYTTAYKRNMFVFELITDKLCRDLVIKSFSEKLEIPQQIANQLLSLFVSIIKDEEPGPPDEYKAMDIFLDKNFIENIPLSKTIILNQAVAGEPAASKAASTPEGGTTTRLQYPDPFPAFTYIRLFKAAQFILKLNLKATDLEYLYNYAISDDPVEEGYLDIFDLPFKSTESSKYFEFYKLIKLDIFNKTALKNQLSLFDYFIHIKELNDTENDIRGYLSGLTGWNIDDLIYLTDTVESFIYIENEIKINEFFNIDKLIKLQCKFDIINLLGTGASEIISVNKYELGMHDSRTIRNIVKLKHGIESWLDVAPKIRSSLREAQRDALMSYVIDTDEEIDNAEELFSKYLIDPQMSACAMTSRLVQASLAIQLYVQRVLMNLEPTTEIKTISSFKNQWNWRKKYRLWEANRKVFMYPENWLEPEFRFNKSSIYEELEEAVLQDDITKEKAQKLYLDYISKLDEVAHLEVVGMYDEVEGELKTLHVIGRTKGSPHKYFYRKWINEFEWTAWEHIDLDIEGNQVLPVVWNNQLYIYWPVWTLVADDSDADLTVPDPDGSYTAQKPDSFYTLKIAWSKLDNNKWNAKKISSLSMGHWFDDEVNNNTIDRVFGASKFGRMDFYIYSEFENKQLNIRVAQHFFSAWYEQRYFKSFTFYFNFQYPDADPKILFNDHVKINDDLSLSRYEDDLFNYRYSKLLIIENPDPQVVQEPKQTALYCWGIDQTGTSYEREQISSKEKNWVYSARFHHSDDGNKLHPVKKDHPFTAHDGSKTFFLYHYTPVDVPGGQIVPGQVQQTLYKSIPPNLLITGEEQSQSSSAKSSSYYGTDQSKLVINREADGNISESGIPVNPSSAPTVSFKQNSVTQTKDPGDPVTYNPYDEEGFHIHAFYHPFSKEFISQLNKYGIDGLLDPIPPGTDDPPNLHRQQKIGELDFDETYGPLEIVKLPSQSNEFHIEEINFDSRSPYANYNWEIFYHTPIMIANRLSQNQRFEEAQQWYHYIFDPTETYEGEHPERKVWKFKPFYELADPHTIDELMKDVRMREPEMLKQIELWENDPFNPHIIAQLRHLSYMKYVVLKYIDNLIAWGDMLFRQDSMESINQAVQLYVLAAQILGPRPTMLFTKEREPQSFKDIKSSLDEFSNILVYIIDIFFITNVPYYQQAQAATTTTSSKSGEKGGFRILSQTTGNITQVLVAYISFYFGLPPNEKLLGYWDLVSDRLFKIRHCMNIKGVVRQLPLFEPPIDPGMLIKARAAGIDLADVLSDMNAPMPSYRYKVLYQKSIELTNDVKALGGALLSALEKKDAEDMALLRAGHQEELYKTMKLIKEKAIEEAQISIESLQLSKKLTEERLAYYTSREYISQQEKLYQDKLDLALTYQIKSAEYEVLASEYALIPNLNIGISGAGGSPTLTTVFGGQFFSLQAQAQARSISINATKEQHAATKASTEGGHIRRWDDWQHQATLAELEIPQIDKQIVGAEIRLAMAEKELENLELQIEQSEIELEFMQDKYTNKELYNWMVGQLSTLYIQSYQMAYDMANRAEKSFRFELGLEDTSFIEYGYWDSLKKGLLSGEKLSKDIQRLDIAYLEENKRELEITKHVSLAMLNPEALIALRNNGNCEFDIPEILYDLDFPGQYFRRIKSVSISIPAVTGPYTNVSCKLSMLGNRYRKNTLGTDGYEYEGLNDPRFAHDIIGIQSIATSSGQNDSGMFQFDFKDERFLPFEGAGAIGKWSLEMPTQYKQFNYDTISDVILHINYTAKDAGGLLKTKAIENIDYHINNFLDETTKTGEGLQRIFSMKAEFANELHQLLNDNTCVLSLKKEHFPYFLNDKDLILDENSLEVTIRTEHESLPVITITNGTTIFEDITLNSNGSNHEGIDDIWLLLKYTINVPSS